MPIMLRGLVYDRKINVTITDPNGINLVCSEGSTLSMMEFSSKEEFKKITKKDETPHVWKHYSEYTENPFRIYLSYEYIQDMDWEHRNMFI